MNQVIIDGRILPNTEKSPKNYAYYPATGDPANGGKNSFLHFLLSTRKEGAAKGEDGYYPTEIWSVKAFGSTADQIPPLNSSEPLGKMNPIRIRLPA